MAKAQINLPNGTKITINGSAEEVKNIVSSVSQKSDSLDSIKIAQKGRKKSKPYTSKKGGGKPGLTSYVLDLKKEGFFKEKRKINVVNDALEKNGHFFPQSSISEVLLRLTKQRKLGRVKQNKAWHYVQRD